jgi:hypothetical protein
MRSSLSLFNSRPDNFFVVLRQWLIIRRGELSARGMACRQHVEHWHDPVRIARDVKTDYGRIGLAKGLPVAAG